MTSKTAHQEQFWKRGFTCNVQTDPPGKRWAVHRHAVDEIVVLVQGKLEVVIGAGKQQLKPGKPCVVPASMPHALHNRGTTQAHYLYGFRHKRRAS
jgi:mannose-6-phosphate isomerase-like protein (cupin superfamily)